MVLLWIWDNCIGIDISYNNPDKKGKKWNC
jgi:hypothetical protein